MPQIFKNVAGPMAHLNRADPRATGLTLPFDRARTVGLSASEDALGLPFDPHAVGLTAPERQDFEKVRAAWVNAIADAALTPASRPQHSLGSFARSWAALFGYENMPASESACLRRLLCGRLLDDPAYLSAAADFPYVLADAQNKVFQAIAPTFSPTWWAIGKVAAVNSLLPVQTSMLQPVGTLPVVEEGEEYNEFKGAGDDGSVYLMHKRGALWGVSFEALERDGAAALRDPAERFAAAAVATEDAEAWGLFFGNPVMKDGKALFSADHGNLMSGQALSPATLKEARKALVAQNAPNGEPLYLRAKSLIVPLAMTDDAAGVLKGIGNTELPPEDRLELVVEPRADVFSQSAWYLAADPARWPGLQVAFIGGVQQPTVRSQWDMSRDTLVVKTTHIFGVGVGDWRGFVMNPGA